WELSAARAVTVARFLIMSGVPPAILGAAGYSEYDLVADNGTEAGRQENRRIEIVLLPNLEEMPKLPANQLHFGPGTRASPSAAAPPSAAPQANAAPCETRSHTTPKPMLAGSAHTPTRKWYTPNARPRTSGGARSAMSAFSTPSVAAKYTP